MDLYTIKTEYEKGLADSLSKKKGGFLKLSETEIRNSLKEWAVMELVRIWLSEGIGNKKTRIRDSKPKRMNTHIKAMLSKLEKHWFEFLKLIEAEDKEIFKNTIKDKMPELYGIWKNDS